MHSELVCRMWHKWLTLPCFSFQEKKWCIQCAHILKSNCKWQKTSQNHGFSYTEISLPAMWKCALVLYLRFDHIYTSTEVHQNAGQDRWVFMKWVFPCLAVNCAAPCTGEKQGTYSPVHWYVYQVQWFNPKMNENFLENF